MTAGDGNGWVQCRCGQRHWGLYGAAGLLLTDNGRVLLQLRSGWVHHGGTWALPGGALDSHEDAIAGALREAHEENGIAPDSVQVLDSYASVDHTDWRFTVVVGRLLVPAHPHPANAESDDVRWLLPGEVTARPLHPAFEAGWPTLRARLGDLLAAEQPRPAVE